MLKNYLKVAWRNLWKHKGFSAINIFGLAIGIACCLLIWNYTKFELSYDNFHPDVAQLYRVNQTNIWSPDGGYMNSTGVPLAQALRDEYPEVEATLRINTPGSDIIRYQGRNGSVTPYYESSILAADSNFFAFFGFKLREGDPSTALIGKNKVVLSQEAAKKIFGSASAIGKVVLYGEDRTPIRVTGVLEQQPHNAHFKFDYLLSINTNPNIEQFEWSWIWSQIVTYVKLSPQTDVAAMEQKLTSLASRYTSTTFTRLGTNFNDFVKGGKWEFKLQPVRDLHLHASDIGNRLGPVGDITYVRIFGVTGFLVLLVAAINFINLSTARGSKRAKEVGVKQALGATRRSLLGQFQIESLLVVLIAGLLSLGIMEVFRWVMLQLLQFEIPFTLWENGLLIWILPPFLLVLGLLAGLYPSIYLTSFRPIQALKGKLITGIDSGTLRNGLVVFQFTIAIMLLASTLVVYQQLQFFLNKDLGFEKSNLLIINQAEKLGTHLDAFENELANYPEVEFTSVSMTIPGRGNYEDIFKKEGSDLQLPIAMVKVDEDFLKTWEVEMIAGRYFEKERVSDHKAAILNETAARLLGWQPHESLGNRIKYVGEGLEPMEVVGVVKDFHSQSLRFNIAPVIMLNVAAPIWGDQRVIAVKFQAANTESLVKKIGSAWNKQVEATPFQYSFFKEEWEQQYQSESRMGSLFGFFTILAMIIAVIGLIGLVSYSVEQRRREISIRKVLGASVLRIISMMNRQYLKLILIGLLLATPIGWWVQQNWLNNFAYHIAINPWTFVIAGLGTLILALVCAGYLSLRAAFANPAHVLKEE